MCQNLWLSVIKLKVITQTKELSTELYAQTQTSEFCAP